MVNQKKQLGGLLGVAIFLAVCATKTVVLAAEELKPDVYYLSTILTKNETSQKETFYIRSLLPKKSQKVSDVIIDGFNGLPSSQWEVKKKSGSQLSSLIPRANKVNTVSNWGGAEKEAKKGYKFTLVGEEADSVYLIERKNPKAKSFYLRHNGAQKAMVLDVPADQKELTEAGSPYLWKFTSVPRARTTTTEAP